MSTYSLKSKNEFKEESKGQSKRPFKKTLKHKKVKKNDFIQCPIILHFLFILNYASFFGPKIFDIICKDLIVKLLNNQSNLFEIFELLNKINLKKFTTKFEFQNEIILCLKINNPSKKITEFQSYFNNSYGFNTFYKTISNLIIKNDILDKKNYKYIFIRNSRGLKVYLLAIKFIICIFVIFRGTEELQNIAINLYSILTEINNNTFNIIPFIMNHPEMFNGYNTKEKTKEETKKMKRDNLEELNNYSNYFIPSIYKILIPSIHSIIEGILDLNLNFLNNDTNNDNIKHCNIYTSGISLGGQLSNIFTFLYLIMVNNSKNNKYFPCRLFTFPFINPEIFNLYSSNIIKNYIETNNLFYLNYFTHNDKTPFLYSKLDKYYHISISNIITSISFNIETNIFSWNSNKKRKKFKGFYKNILKNGTKTPMTVILEILNSLVHYHQNICGYITNSIIHPCYFISPYILYKITYEINKKDFLYNLYKNIIDNLFIDVVENNETKKIQLYNYENIIKYWNYFRINFETIFKKYDINILKLCYTNYNFFHGFEKNDFIDRHIFTKFNRNLYYNKNFDFKFLLNIIKLKLSFIENYQWIQDILCYIIKIIFLKSKYSKLFITYS